MSRAVRGFQMGLPLHAAGSCHKHRPASSVTNKDMSINHAEGKVASIPENVLHMQ